MASVDRTGDSPSRSRSQGVRYPQVSTLTRPAHNWVNRGGLLVVLLLAVLVAAPGPTAGWGAPATSLQNPAPGRPATTGPHQSASAPAYLAPKFQVGEK